MTNKTILSLLDYLCNEARNSVHATFGLMALSDLAADPNWQSYLNTSKSSADRLLDTPREELAARIWREVAEIAGIAGPLPPWQIVRERRATFAALPREDAKRPGPQTRWNNLVLAGDWTATGLPATIEGAIRSGNRAAGLIVETS